MSAAELLPHNPAMAALREAWGGAPNKGYAQKNPIGDVTTPALYVCGTLDPAIKCNHPYAKKTAQYCKGGYTYIEAICGHAIVETGLLGCPLPGQTNKILDGIITHIKAASMGGTIQV